MPTSQKKPVDCSELAASLAELALAHGEAGLKTLDEVVDAIRRDLPEVDRATIADAIVAYSKRPAPKVNKDEVRATIADLKKTARMDAATRAKIADLQRQLRTGDIKAPEPRAKKVYDETLENLRSKRDTLRKKINQEISKTKEQGVFKTFAAAPFEEFRALMTTGELSYLLRQGGFFSIANPVSNAKQFLPSLKAFKGKNANKIDQMLRPGNENSVPNAANYEKSGLHLPDPEIVDNPKNSEEAFQTDLPITTAISKALLKITRTEGTKAENYTPDQLVRGFGHSYITFLNLQRAMTFDTLVGTLAKYGEPTLKEMKAIAKFINIATGRGDLGKAEAAISQLNTIFFAPRYVMSRFQLLLEPPRAAMAQITNPAVRAFNKATGKNTKVPDRHLFGGTTETDKLILMEYAKYAAGITALLTAASYIPGVEIEKDPRSTDFGKVRIGNTRMDPFSGLQQVSVFLTKQMTAESKSTKTGEVEEMDAEAWLKNLLRFGRGKLAPLWSTALDLKLGENIVGERVAPLRSKEDAAEFAVKLLTPITYRDIYKIMKSDYGMDSKAALAATAILGAGIQSYDPLIPQAPDNRYKIPKEERDLDPSLPTSVTLSDEEYEKLLKAHEFGLQKVEKERKKPYFSKRSRREQVAEIEKAYNEEFEDEKNDIVMDAALRLKRLHK